MSVTSKFLAYSVKPTVVFQLYATRAGEPPIWDATDIANETHEETSVSTVCSRYLALQAFQNVTTDLYQRAYLPSAPCALGTRQ